MPLPGTPYKDINIDQTMNTEGLIGFGHPGHTIQQKNLNKHSRKMR